MKNLSTRSQEDALLVSARAMHAALNAPQVSRRALLALGSLMALGIQGCGSGSNTRVTAASQVGKVVTTLAGQSQAGHDDGSGVLASFNGPVGIAVDDSGNLFVADQVNHLIRKITPAGVVSTFAGDVTQTAGAYVEGTGTGAAFHTPTGVAVDDSGNVYVADFGNNRIRKITSAGVTSTIAGNGMPTHLDGTGAAASLYMPCAVAFDRNNRNLYVVELAACFISEITSAGVVSVFAGGGQGSADGTGNAARFEFPTGIAVDGNSNLYVSDTGNHTIRKISPSRVVSTWAGQAGQPGTTDGVGPWAQFNQPAGLTVDSSGNVYVADTSNATIRYLSPLGNGGVATVTTLAGTVANQGFLDAPIATAQFNQPAGVAVDSHGNVYVADSGNYRIRKIA